MLEQGKTVKEMTTTVMGLQKEVSQQQEENRLLGQTDEELVSGYTKRETKVSKRKNPIADCTP